MRRLAIAFLALAAAAPSGLALADECKAPQTTAAMVTCADKDFKAADAALNAQWKKTLATIRQADKLMGGDAKLVEKLRKAERAWIAFRDAECELEGAQMYGGTQQPVLEITCRTDLTERRTKDLEDLEKAFASN